MDDLLTDRVDADTDAETLAWEYLDGFISSARAALLSTMLTEKAQARQAFVETAVLHGMLTNYYGRDQGVSSAASDAGEPVELIGQRLSAQVRPTAA